MPATAFEVQEAQQNLSTSFFTLKDFLIKVKGFDLAERREPFLSEQESIFFVFRK